MQQIFWVQFFFLTRKPAKQEKGGGFLKVLVGRFIVRHQQVP